MEVVLRFHIILRYILPTKWINRKQCSGQRLLGCDAVWWRGKITTFRMILLPPSSPWIRRVP